MTNVGSIVYDASIDTSQFNRDSRSLENSAESAGENIERSFTQRIESMQPAFRKMAVVGTAAFAAIGLGVNRAVNAAADAEQIDRNFAIVFGNAADETDKFVREFSQQFGRAESATRLATTSIGSMLQISTTLGEDAMSSLTREMMQSAESIAFYDHRIDNAEQAAQGFNNAIAGNTQQLRMWGFDINEARLEQQAFEMGLISTGEELSRNDRATALSALIYEQTAGSRKLLAESEGSYQDTLARSQATQQEMMESIGGLFLPMMNDLRQALIPVINSVKAWTEENPELTRNIIIAAAAIAGIVAVVGTLGLIIIPVIKGFTAIIGIFKAVGSGVVFVTKLLAPLVKGIMLLVGAVTIKGIIIAAVIAAVVAGFIWLWRNWQTVVDNVRRFARLAGEGFSMMRDVVVNAIRRLVSGVVNGGRAVIDWFRNLPSTILRALGGIGMSLYNSGRNLITGFLNGIKSMASAPVEAIQDMAGRMRDLLPFSPAKEGPFSGSGWVDNSGMSIAESLADGLVRGTRNAVSATQGLVGGISANISPGMASISSMDSGGGAGSMIENNINTININNDVDGEMWIKRLTKNQEITSSRLSPRREL